MIDKIKTREDLCAFIMALPRGWEVTVCTDWSMPEIIGYCRTGDIQEIKRYLEIRIDGPSVVREINSHLPLPVEHPIATNRPSLYTGKGSHRHYFADHQHCLKCGKWECAPEADDCEMSDLDFENFARAESAKRLQGRSHG